MKEPALLQIAMGILFLAAASDAAESPTYTVIVNPSNPATTSSRIELSRLFLKKVTAWPAGRAVLPVDQIDTSTIRDVFTKDIHKKSIAAIKSFWQQRIFSGGDVPPPELESDAEVIAYIRTHPGAVGYVAEIPLNAGVKVLKISG